MIPVTMNAINKAINKEIDAFLNKAESEDAVTTMQMMMVANHVWTNLKGRGSVESEELDSLILEGMTKADIK